MSEALWYLGRGSGVTALVLFSVVMVLGVLTRGGVALPGLPRFVVAGLHRSTSLTAVLFLVVHMVTLFFDPYAQLHLLDTVVPFFGEYRPVWQGLGTLAFDLTLVLVATSLLRERIGRRTWKVLHGSAYLMWPVAVAHGLGNGTDATSAWMLTTVGVCVAAVGAAVLWRLRSIRFASPPAPRAMPAPVAMAVPR